MACNIAFVILHFNTLDDTERCIKSIENRIDVEDFKIVIVDNGSPNGSGETLENIYQRDYRVEVLKTGRNLGFANGNNFGIEYALKHYQPKYICCINSDTELEISNFYHLIDEEYEKSKCAVIGPKILKPDGKEYQYHQEILCLSEYKEEYRKYSSKLYLTQKIIKAVIRNICSRTGAFKKFYEKRDIDIYKNINMPEVRKEGVKLHGCCLIFTPMFFDKLKGFNNKTFLYREEELLWIDLYKNGLKAVYLPYAQIKHYEDGSTNTIVPSPIKKVKFRHKHQVDSLKILISEMEEMENMKHGS